MLLKPSALHYICAIALCDSYFIYTVKDVLPKTWRTRALNTPPQEASEETCSSSSHQPTAFQPWLFGNQVTKSAQVGHLLLTFYSNYCALGLQIIWPFTVWLHGFVQHKRICLKGKMNCLKVMNSYAHFVLLICSVYLRKS